MCQSQWDREASNKLVAEGARRMAEAIEIDVAFLLDGTQSMDEHRLAALNNCEEVAHVITQRYPLAKIRFALVVYRDFQKHVQYGDGEPFLVPMGDDQFEVLDFGTVEALYARLERTQTFGGGDFAEDVDGGLKKLLNLSWRSSSAVTKVAVWIADAPAHGKRFNDLGPRDDMHLGEEIGDPIESVRRLRWQRIQLCFFRINGETDKMLDVLSLNYNRAGSNKKLKLRTYDLGSDPSTCQWERTRTLSFFRVLDLTAENNPPLPGRENAA